MTTRAFEVGGDGVLRVGGIGLCRLVMNRRGPALQFLIKGSENQRRVGPTVEVALVDLIAFTWKLTRWAKP